ncbi:hypothetical protein [Algibacter sp. Ld11]|uniref:hypothetical protein n=1 Tax=Algibacter sp. Ld11 TaxID=649150 RepID=UPI00386CFA14
MKKLNKINGVELKFFDRIGLDNYYDKSLVEKINLLLVNGVFNVSEKDWKDFNLIVKSRINDPFYGESSDDKIIANLPYLRVNPSIASEIELIVSSSFSISVFEYELKEEYEGRLLASINIKHKEKIIHEILLEISGLLQDELKWGLSIFQDANENFDRVELLKKVDFYYNDLLGCVDFYGDNEMSEQLHEEFVNFKIDCICHVVPGGPDFSNPLLYLTASDFCYINRLLNTLEFFKNKLRKINHNQVVVGDSNYCIEKVINKENRFPLVFKDAYSCELFMYTLSFVLDPKPIVFSYFFEIFIMRKYFKKNIKHSHYLAFVNKVYGMSEVRIRKELSNKIIDLYNCQLINREAEFKLKCH